MPCQKFNMEISPGGYLSAKSVFCAILVIRIYGYSFVENDLLNFCPSLKSVSILDLNSDHFMNKIHTTDSIGDPWIPYKSQFPKKIFTTQATQKGSKYLTNGIKIALQILKLLRNESSSNTHTLKLPIHLLRHLMAFLFASGVIN